VSTITKPVTVDEYDQMIEDGTIGENDHVELWDGTVVPKMPKNPRHRVGTRKTAEALERVIPHVWHVAKEEAVVMKPRSKPEPDVAVIRAELKYDSSRDATAADCCLVVEVADRSLADDQGKKLAGFMRGPESQSTGSSTYGRAKSRCTPVPTRRRVSTATTSITVPVKLSRSSSTGRLSARSLWRTCSRSISWDSTTLRATLVQIKA